MKQNLALLSLLSLLAINVSCSSNKYDKKRMDIQRQEAHAMVDRSNDIVIKKGLGDDKIILQDQ